MAYQAGLATAGIMDHDSISGAEEFIEAGKIVGMATTIGIECRVDFPTHPLSGRRINNPDQDSVAYMAFMGYHILRLIRWRNTLSPTGNLPQPSQP
jgi:DNA polymerase III alpha subunit